MGLLSETAHRIVNHLKTRDHDPLLSAALDGSTMQQYAALTNAYRKLMAGQGLSCDGVRIESHLQEFRGAEGVIRWGEVWVYPSVDLRMYVDKFGPYDPDLTLSPPQRKAPQYWDATLQVCLSAPDCWLPIAIPLRRLAWTEPRISAQKLKRFATRAGYSTQRAFEEMFLNDFQQPDPDTGLREWRIHVNNKTLYKEVLTNLAIGALKYGFPVTEADQHTALAWVNCVIRDGFRRWRIDKETRQQWSDELSGVVFQRLIDTFDLPSSERSLRDYITKTARGLKRDELKKNNPSGAEPYIDPASGHCIYPDAYVSRDLSIQCR